MTKKTIALLALAFTACTKTETPTPTTSARRAIAINGAEPTFPYPIYSKWFSDYNKLHPDIQINISRSVRVGESNNFRRRPFCSAPPTAR